MRSLGITTSPLGIGRQFSFLLAAALVIAALTYRVALATQPPVIRGDGLSRYEPLARNLLAGRGLSAQSVPPYRPSEIEVPGYPAFVAVMLGLTGSVRALFTLQLVLEAVTLWLTRSIALELGLTPLWASVAGALGLFCPFLPSVAWQMATEALACFLVALFLLALLRAATRKPWRHGLWALSGIVGGLACLVRVDCYAVITLCTAAVLAAPVNRIQLRRSAAPLALLLALLGTLTPWILRAWLLFGTPELPGQRQFTYSHVGRGFRAWLDTWIDDGAWLEAYVWGPRDSRPRTFPADKIPDPIERQRAEKAFRNAMESGRDPFPAQVDAEFEALARSASETRWLETQLWVRLRRLISAWLRVPSNTDYLGRPSYRLKVLVYAIWGGVLVFSGLGLAASRNGAWSLAPAIALVASRSLIPFSSAWGLEVRYLYEALPGVLVLAAFGCARVWSYLSSPATARHTSGEGIHQEVRNRCNGD